MDAVPSSRLNYVNDLVLGVAHHSSGGKSVSYAREATGDSGVLRCFLVLTLFYWERFRVLKGQRTLNSLQTYPVRV